jgi:hypothetical protein
LAALRVAKVEDVIVQAGRNRRAPGSLRASDAVHDEAGVAAAEQKVLERLRHMAMEILSRCVVVS